MAQWLRLHLGQGEIDGQQIITAMALAETYRPGLILDNVTKPADQSYTTYGLGWNVGVDELGRVKLSHSGAFALGAGTTVYMLPSEQLGIVILSNAAPIGVVEGLAQTFLDNATYGKSQNDWLTLYKGAFATLGQEDVSPIDYAKPPAQLTPALANVAYVGTYTNDFIGNVEIVAKG
jgi:CubicO group peptidase (beta-lactamase class C family)